jgi:hypothetical protein
MKKNDETEQILTEKFLGLNPVMNEMSRRRWAAVEARALGYGGVSIVSRATGLSRGTIKRTSRIISRIFGNKD